MSDRRKRPLDSKKSIARMDAADAILQTLGVLGELHLRAIGLACQTRDEHSPEFRLHVIRTLRGYRKPMVRATAYLIRLITDLE